MTNTLKQWAATGLLLTACLYVLFYIMSLMGPVAVTYPDGDTITRDFRPMVSAVISTTVAFAFVFYALVSERKAPRDAPSGESK